MEIGEKIRAERLKQRITGRQFVKLAGINWKTLRDIESGVTTNPTPVVLAKIETALGWDYGTLVES